MRVLKPPKVIHAAKRLPKRGTASLPEKHNQLSGAATQTSGTANWHCRPGHADIAYDSGMQLGIITDGLQRPELQRSIGEFAPGLARRSNTTLPPP